MYVFFLLTDILLEPCYKNLLKISFLCSPYVSFTLLTNSGTQGSDHTGLADSQVNQVQRFALTFSLEATSISSLLKATPHKCLWSPEAQQAFDKLKELFTFTQILESHRSRHSIVLMVRRVW